VFWLLERGRNPDFPKSYPRGVWEGIWYTVVTLVTVGYGDRTAKTVPGRLVAMSWMTVSLLLVAGFTANITSQLTLSRFQGIIQGPEDLPGKRIATVTGSTAAGYLEERRLPYRGVEAVEDAYKLLEAGQVDAVVYDGPVLQYYALNEGQGKVQTVGTMFDRQYYGIALPVGSADREAINLTLLEIVEDGTYDRLMYRWFGDAVN
jgi:ABC-type amino acid transport substrate-binding protein